MGNMLVTGVHYGANNRIEQVLLGVADRATDRWERQPSAVGVGEVLGALLDGNHVGTRYEIDGRFVAGPPLRIVPRDGGDTIDTNLRPGDIERTVADLPRF